MVGNKADLSDKRYALILVTLSRLFLSYFLDSDK
jgi:hypothetical protein